MMFDRRPLRYSPDQELAFAMLRILFGVIWTLNAVIEANAPYVNGFLGSIVKRMKGQPHVIVAYLSAVIHTVTLAGPQHMAIATVILDALLALSLLSGVALRPMAWIGVVYTLLLWSTVGGFGGPYTAGATDPGTAIVYALVFIAVLSVPAGQRLTLAGPQANPPTPRGIEVVRILFGLLWAFDAFWKWQPDFLHGSLSYLVSSEVGQPAWIAHYIAFFVQIMGVAGPLAFGIFAAAAETVLALSLLAGFAQKWILPAGLLYSFGLWTTAEGWGGPYALGSTGNRGDMLGTANIYVIVYLFLIVAYLYGRTDRGRPGA